MLLLQLHEHSSPSGGEEEKPRGPASAGEHQVNEFSKMKIKYSSLCGHSFHSSEEIRTFLGIIYFFLSIIY